MEVEAAATHSDSSGSGSGGGEGRSASGDESESHGAGSWTLEELFDRIMHECRHNSPGQCFSAKVREEIERLSLSERARLVSRQRHGCAPLFLACARGNLPAAEYLVAACGAELEQRGLYRAAADAAPHRVTPLWAAAVAGRLDVLRALADAGADLDAGSDSGSTPLRSACFMSHLAVARFLIARGADVAAPNHTGGTCLVNAVQSPELVRLLLASGAPVDARDAQHKTALHYAVVEQREDSARLLLAAGADPLLRSRAGDDALQLACLKGAARLVLHFVQALPQLAPARVADAYELLGATQLDEYNDAAAARVSWRIATALRARDLLPKRPAAPTPPPPALRGAREWTTQAQLAQHANDVDWLRTQALLVALRVLGPTHNDTLFRLMYRGAAYADAGRFARCVELWTWVLELRIVRDTALHTETNQTLLALTRLLLEGAGGGAETRAGEEAPRHALMLLRKLCEADALPEWQRLAAQRPLCREQGGMFDRTLRCVLHLLHVALCGVGAPAQLAQLPPAQRRRRRDFEHELRNQVKRLVALELCASGTGDSLLHLACSALTMVRSTYFADDMPPPEAVFPSAGVVRLLAASGADVTRRNHARCTPLHLATIPYNFSTDLVETLLACGAHLDQPNWFGDSPAELVQLNPHSRVRPLHHLSLACLAARALLRPRAAPRPRPRDVTRAAPALPPALAARLPDALRPFVLLHLP